MLSHLRDADQSSWSLRHGPPPAAANDHESNCLLLLHILIVSAVNAIICCSPSKVSPVTQASESRMCVQIHLAQGNAVTPVAVSQLVLCFSQFVHLQKSNPTYYTFSRKYGFIPPACDTTLVWCTSLVAWHIRFFFMPCANTSSLFQNAACKILF